MKKLLTIAILSLWPSWALAGDIVIGSFQGLNTQDNPVALEDGEAQDLLNVGITPGGKSVYKREGYGLHKTLSFSTSAVHGLHYFQDTSGSDIQLYGHDIYLSASVNGASPVDLATGTVNATWQCTDNSGFAYCVNSSRDTPVRTSGTSGTTSFQSGIPKGTMVTNTPDRMIVAGVSGAESSLYFSQANTFTNFTIGINSADPFVEVINSPGSRLTHIRYACGKLLWWKDGSFGYSVGSDQYNLENVTISQNIGSLDNSSDEYNGMVYFRGQDNHIYVYDCANVTRLSRKITPTVAGSGRRKANSWTQTSQSDFGAGSVTLNGPSLALSTAIFSGDVRPSSITFVDTSTTNFNAGTYDLGISTDDVPGSLVLKTYIYDTFSNLSKWTQTIGSPSVASSILDFDDTNTLLISTFTNPSGHFVVQFDFSDTAASAQNEGFQVAVTTSTGQGTKNGAYYLTIYAHQASGEHRISLSSTSAGGLYWDETNGGGNPSFTFNVGFHISSATIGSYSGSSKTIRWVRNNTTGAMQVIWNGAVVLSCVDTAFSTFKNVQMYVNQAPGVGHVQVDNFYTTASQGNFTSKVYDTAFSTPVWGTFSASTSGGGSYLFATKTSANGTSFDSEVSVTTGSIITSSAKRYIVYSSTISTTTVVSPQIADMTVVAASTGTYYSAVNNASAISSWGTFGANDQTSGGSVAYYVRSSTGIFTVNSSTPQWASQSKNATVSYATGTYMQMRADFGVTYATNTIALNDFTFNWFEGSASDKSYIKYWNDYVWIAVSSGTAGLNNRIQRWDVLNQTWLLDDIAANGFLVDNNSLYFGSPSAGKIFKYGNGLTTDDSGNINSYWKSKNFAGDDPFLMKNWDQSDFVVKAASPTVMTVTYQLDGSATGISYLMNLYHATKTILHKGINLVGKLGWYYNVQFGDNSSNPRWEVFGYRAKYTNRTWQPE